MLHSRLRLAYRARAQRNAVEPVAQQIGITDRVRLLSQNQEDGLEGVFGVVAVMQKVVADAENHRPVAQDECCKRTLAGRVSRAVKRSRSSGSDMPATELPSKREPICRTTEPDVSDAMDAGFLYPPSISLPHGVLARTLLSYPERWENSRWNRSQASPRASINDAAGSGLAD